MKRETTIKGLRRSLSEMSTVMYKIYVEWKVSQRKALTETEHIAENMYRMMIFKAKSIGLMCKGIVIIRTQEGIIPDPSTVFPVLRSMYELLFLFRCLFVSSRNDIERELLHNLWNVKGNNNLIQIPDDELDEISIKKKAYLSDENEILKRKIRERMTELTLPQSAVGSIEKIINPGNNSPTLKGFMFKHCGQSDNITKFCALAFSDATMGRELSNDSFIYSHYSAHSHPSYLGLKHFEEMYINKEEDCYVQEILQHTCKYLNRFMKDFCKYDESYLPFYSQEENHLNNLLNRIIQV